MSFIRGARALSVLISAIALSACQGAFFGTLNRGGGGDVPVQSIAYSTDPALALDLYLPAANAPTPAPVAVFFYGGSWRGGSRADYAFVGKALADAGIVTIVADYRAFPQARFPGFMDDAARAVRWARDNAAAHGGDPRRVFLMGHSAGAHIAALLATDARYLSAVGIRPGDIAGVVGIAGPYDFLPLTDPKLIEVFGSEEEWPESQPINFVDGDEPPFLLLHGVDDRVVWLRNSESLASRLRAVDVPVTLREYEGLGHFRILAAIRFPRLAPTLADTARYILAPRTDTPLKSAQASPY